MAPHLTLEYVDLTSSPILTPLPLPLVVGVVEIEEEMLQDSIVMTSHRTQLPPLTTTADAMHLVLLTSSTSQSFDSIAIMQYAVDWASISLQSSMNPLLRVVKTLRTHNKDLNLVLLLDQVVRVCLPIPMSMLVRHSYWVLMDKVLVKMLIVLILLMLKITITSKSLSLSLFLIVVDSLTHSLPLSLALSFYREAEAPIKYGQVIAIKSPFSKER